MQRGVEAREGARVQVGIAIVDANDIANRAKACCLPDRDDIFIHFCIPHHCRIALQSGAIAAAVFKAPHEVEHGVVFLAEQADRVVFHDPPIVEREGEARHWLDDDADRAVVRTLGRQVGTALRRALNRVAAFDGVLIWIAAVLRCIDAGVVVADVLPRHDGLVDRDQIRCAERFGPRGADEQGLYRTPSRGQLAHDGVAHVREVLVTGGGLDVQPFEHGDVELAEQGRHPPAAAVVGRRAGVHHVRDVGIGDAAGGGERDRAVEARIAVVVERLATQLHAGDEANGAGGQREQVATVELEIREQEFHLVVAHHVHQGAFDVRVDAAAKRVVRRRRRVRQRLRHQVVGNPVAREVLAGGAGIQRCDLPVPRAAAAAESLQEPIHVAIVLDLPRHLGVAVVVDQKVQPFGRDIRDHVRRQAIGRTDRAERVVVVLLVERKPRNRKRVRRMPRHAGVCGIEHQLGKALGAARQLVIQKREQRRPPQLRREIAQRVQVVAFGALAVDGAADAAVDLPLAALVAGGKHLELAGAVGKRVAQSGAARVRHQIELAVAGVCAGVAEVVVAGPRRTVADERAQVAVGPARILLRVDALPRLHAAHDAEVGAAAVEGRTPREIEVQRLAVQALVPAVPGADAEPLVVGVEHVVHDAGDRVGAVDGRGAVLEDLHAIDAVHRNGVGVDGIHGHETAAHLFGLVAGGVHHAPTVQQHQRVAGAEIAQVEGADVAARGVHAAADVLLFVEEVLALFGQQLQQLVAGVDAEQLGVFATQHRHRQHAGDVGTANLRAGCHHHLADDVVADESTGNDLRIVCRLLLYSTFLGADRAGQRQDCGERHPISTCVCHPHSHSTRNSDQRNFSTWTRVRRVDVVLGYDGAGLAKRSVHALGLDAACGAAGRRRATR